MRGNNDPRGPLQKIVEVQEYRLTRLDHHSGGCTPVILDCGHVRELNPTFHYAIGDDCRCFTCADCKEKGE